jgi:hypothetical protein
MNVKLKPDEIDEIAKIIGGQKCPFDFRCYKSGFKDLCGAVLGPILDSGNPVVECVDEKAKKCRYSSPFGSTFVCACPMRCYIARHFHK